MDDSPAQADSLPQGRGRQLRLLPWIGGFLLGTVVTLGAAYATRAWWLRSTYPPFGSPSPFIEVYSGNAQNSPILVLTDWPTSDTLRSMLSADETRLVAAGAAGKPAYTIRFGRPPGIHVGPTPGIEIVHEANGYVWSDGGKRYRLFGDFDAFLKALPAVRCVQLLQNSRAAEREEGRRLKSLQYDVLCDALIAASGSENPQLQGWALDNLARLVGKMPVFGHQPWAFGHDWSRSPQAPRAADVRRAALSAIERALHSGDALQDIPTRYGFGGGACECLQQTGDAATADALVSLLSRDMSRHWTDSLMGVLEGIHGLPPTYDKRLICGNSLREERGRFAQEEQVRCLAARDKLIRWHLDHANEETEARYDAILEAWQEYVTAHARELRQRQERGPQRFTRLLSLGPDLLPALERRRSRAQSLLEQGFWEMVRAYLTEDCDAKLVEQLLAGDNVERMQACRIVTASGQPKWRDQLVPLLNAPFRDANLLRDPGDIAALREAAAFALLACHGPEVLPELRRADEQNYIAKQAVRFYDQPTNISP